MVAVKMADEDVVKSGKLEFHAAHAELSALATVNHHQVIPEVDNLASREVAQRWCSRAASKDIYTKSCHFSII